MDKDSDPGELTPSSASKKLKQNQVALGSHSGNSSSTVRSIDSTELMNMDGSSFDLACHTNVDQDNNDIDNQDLDYHSDYDDEDIYDDYEDFSVNDDEYSLLQSQFDNMDFPSGVEASVSLLTDPSSGKNLPETKSSTNSDVTETEKKESATSILTAHAESGSNSELDGINPETEKKGGAMNSLTAHAESGSNDELDGNNNDSAVVTSQLKNFYVVDELADHHYARLEFSDAKPHKDWAKKIQQEWKILENDLPDTIYVRVCEARMELLRAVIVGPSGTPYHDGLFVFDCLFPTNYPNSPPSVYYYSGGLRLNPNLYNCGKVCLSLLGTWTGSNKNENWVPGKSTMLQVLVSIQALILNSKPFFNEPGHETFTGEMGERRSYKYNEDVFILSLKTMVYTLRRPPKHFEELVVQHFRLRARDILVACKAYMEGALVGSDIKDGVNNRDDQTSSSREFKSAVADMMNLLVTSFSRNGALGCEEFRLPTKK